MEGLDEDKVVYLLFGWPRLVVGGAFAGADKMLAYKHVASGVGCGDCHNGNAKPKAAAGVEGCLKCHGGYKGMAEKATKLEHNPHDAHVGEVVCTECHKAHSKSVLYCNTCHNFDFKVP